MHKRSPPHLCHAASPLSLAGGQVISALPKGFCCRKLGKTFLCHLTGKVEDQRSLKTHTLFLQGLLLKDPFPLCLIKMLWHLLQGGGEGPHCFSLT